MLLQEADLRNAVGGRSACAVEQQPLVDNGIQVLRLRLSGGSDFWGALRRCGTAGLKGGAGVVRKSGLKWSLKARSLRSNEASGPFVWRGSKLGTPEVGVLAKRRATNTNDRQNPSPEDPLAAMNSERTSLRTSNRPCAFP